MTTQELIKQMIERCGVIGETTDAYFLSLAAQRLRELDAQVTELELKLLTERGAKAC